MAAGYCGKVLSGRFGFKVQSSKSVGTKKIGNDGNRLKTDGNRGMNRRLLSSVARVSMIWVRTFYLDLV